MGSPIIWAGNNAKNLKDNLEFRESIIKTGTFAAANNQATPADVTGLTFNGTRGGNAVVTIVIDATSDLFATYNLQVIQKSSTYQMSQEFTGDATGITFSITSSGQIQYTSTNEAGFVSSTIKFNFTTLDS